MKSVSKIIAVVTATAALISSAAYASGGTGAPSITATANANVVTPVTVSEATQLNFGSFAASPTAQGTIDTSGNVTNGVNAVPSTGVTPGKFSVAGLASQGYSIVVDPNVKLTDGSGDAMTATLAPSATTGTIGSGGADNFTVAGLLTVPAAQAAAGYKGNYNVAVHY